MRSLSSWQIPFLGLRHFPANLTLFEIRTFFSFSEQERTAIRSRRGDHLRLAFGIHVGFLKMTGTTLSALDRIPIFVLSGVWSPVVRKRTLRCNISNLTRHIRAPINDNSREQTLSMFVAECLWSARSRRSQVLNFSLCVIYVVLNRLFRNPIWCKNYWFYPDSTARYSSLISAFCVQPYVVTVHDRDRCRDDPFERSHQIAQP